MSDCRALCVTGSIVLLTLLIVSSALGDEPSAVAKPKEAGPSGAPAIQDRSNPSQQLAQSQSLGRLTGDTADDPIWLEGNPPHTVMGNTCDFQDDYDEICPYSGSTSPDVVYALQVPHEEILHVELCESGYDTKVYIYEDAVTPGFPYACNDDACGSDGYRSRIESVWFRQGHTYYIVVDGYGSGGSCGDYTLETEYTWECVFCSEQAIHEGEPNCYDGYEDTYNAGCNSDPPTFLSLEPSEDPVIEVCGIGGTYRNLDVPMRDTDWYEIVLEGVRMIRCEAVADFTLQVQLLDGRQGCENVQMIDSGTGAACVNIEFSQILAPGTYWIWVGPQEPTGVDCDEEYHLFIEGHTPGSSGIPSDQDPSGSPPILAVRPDPFARETMLHFTLISGGPVTLEILDPAGRMADRLLDEAHLEPGGHAVPWLPNRAARAPGSGLYFARLRMPDGVWTRRLVYLE